MIEQLVTKGVDYMSDYQTVISIQKNLSKAERCLELFDSYLDVTYVEDEERLRNIINYVLTNYDGVKNTILELIESHSSSEEIDYEIVVTLNEYMRDIAEVLAQLNMSVFDDFIIGFDIIINYCWDED